MGKIASIAAVIALGAACCGCAAAGAAGLAAEVVPSVTTGSAGFVASQIALGKSDNTPIKEQEDSYDPDKCDQLLQFPPGVEEVRKNKDGLIESRQWKIVKNGGSPTWEIVRAKDAPEDGWQPKPGIGKLHFNPPLAQMLEPDKPRYLAYALANVVNVSDSEQFDSMTGTFGLGAGTFQWRGRSYSYVLVKKLPCFKPAKEK